MLTKADDYPIHQMPVPVADDNPDPNLYERYFFNGYSKLENAYFGVAFGIYPNRGIADATFSVLKDGVQHNVRVSKHIRMEERFSLQAGPISIDVLAPLRSLRIKLTENSSGIRADLIFTACDHARQEPRSTFQLGENNFVDLTRLTQNGRYEGTLEIDGKTTHVTPGIWMGSRDRSWGKRPLSAAKDDGSSEPNYYQLYFIWAPIHFDDCTILYSTNQDAEGNERDGLGFRYDCQTGEDTFMNIRSCNVTHKKGTRRIETGQINMETDAGELIRIEIEPLYNFYMSGIGYNHSEWNHGVDKGKYAFAYDTIDLSTVDETALDYQHIQAMSRFKIGDRTGIGALEQFFIGPHKPSGFEEFLDMAK